MEAVRRSLKVALVVALALGLGSLTACVVAVRPAHEAVIVEGPPPAGGEVVIAQAPPPAPVEVVTVAPAPGYIWVGGYWGWRAGGYYWVRGGWHCPPRPGAVWVGGYWSRRPSGHVWVRGGWR
jgi:hypothetical protein